MHRRHVVACARGLGGGLPHDGVWDDEDTGKRQAEADDGRDGEGAPGGEGGGEQQRRVQQLERQQDAPLAPPPRGHGQRGRAHERDQRRAWLGLGLG